MYNKSEDAIPKPKIIGPDKLIVALKPEVGSWKGSGRQVIIRKKY